MMNRDVRAVSASVLAMALGGTMMMGVEAAVAKPLKNTGITLTKVEHRAGKLVIQGRTAKPFQAVTLDYPAVTKRSGSRRAFKITAPMVPGDCVIWLKVKKKFDLVKVGNCGPAGPTGPTGPQGPAGDTGPAGSPGAPGASTLILGTLADTAALAGVETPTAGSGYIIDGDLWVYAGDDADGAGDGGFMNVGRIQGATGELGPIGPIGADGAAGSPGQPGAQGDIGAVGATGPQGEPGPAGSIGANRSGRRQG
jgi:hypothetical protein